MKLKQVTFSAIICLLLSACFGQPQQIVENDPFINRNALWPTRRWQVSTLPEQGLEPAYFEEMQDYIEQNRYDIHSLLVIRHGYLVYEEYGSIYSADMTHNQYSVTKSVVGTLVGIAIDQGYIPGVDEPILELLPDRIVSNVDRRKPNITLDHVLTMSAGIDWQEGDPAFDALYTSQDWVQHMLEKPMSAEPGSHFLYCSGCSHLLTAVLAESTGQDVIKFANENLFKPLGITDYTWNKDAQDIPVGGWGLFLTPRDMAKIGYLYLNQGQWDGKQVVSTDWIDRSTSPRIQTGGNLEYGYQWWIYSHYDAYTAMGRYGQTIFVIPKFDMVIVVTAEASSHDPIFDIIDRYIVPSVLNPGN
jgi:CubicO group peptidase (beta-lactamase class C family)